MMSPDSAAVRSWYAATANPHPDRPPLDGERRCDVVVVGGGFTGLSTALNLAETGYDVVLLEARRVGWGASGRNGGQIVGGYNRSMGQIARLIGGDGARALWDMNEEAKAIIGDRVARHAIGCDLKWGYLLAAIKRRHLDELRHTADDWAAYGYRRARLVDAEAVRDIVACPHYVGGLVDDGGGQLHPLNYALGLAAAAETAGVRIFERSPVERLDGDGPTVVARTAQGDVRARFAALAGNAYLPALSPAAGRAMRRKIMPVGTSIIATEPLGGARAAALIPAGVAVADVNFVLNYYRLSADHRMLFGGGVSYSTVDRPDLARSLKRTMSRYFPSLAAVRIDYVWGGHVAITVSRLPHFGRVAPNVFFAQGFSGHGVALTGLAGRLMAEAIAGTAERFDVFARIPHRPFPGGGALRTPALVLAMRWYRLRDLL